MEQGVELGISSKKDSNSKDLSTSLGPSPPTRSVISSTLLSMVPSIEACPTNIIMDAPAVSLTLTTEPLVSSSISKSETESFPKGFTFVSNTWDSQPAEKSSWPELERMIARKLKLIRKGKGFRPREQCNSLVEQSISPNPTSSSWTPSSSSRLFD